MTKAANIYWDNGTRRARGKDVTRRAAVRRTPRTRTQARAKRHVPWWMSFLIVTSIFVMLTVSINFRAFREMRDEAEQNSRLSSKITNLQDENLALQEEIHTLKSDPKVIEREAKRIGIDLNSDK